MFVAGQREHDLEFRYRLYITKCRLQPKRKAVVNIYIKTNGTDNTKGWEYNLRLAPSGIVGPGCVIGFLTRLQEASILVPANLLELTVLKKL